MLIKYKMKYMLTIPHVKQWIKIEARLRARNFSWETLRTWFITKPGTEVLSVKCPTT